MRLLLDGHVSAAVAEQLAGEGVDIVHLRDWLGGVFLNEVDDQILAAASTEQRVLVTYDLRTVKPLLQEWADAGLHHGGVILIDDQTIHQNDVGGLIRALRALIKQRPAGAS